VLFPLGAVLLGLLPLGLLELGLRVFDVGRPAAAPDPFGGFNRRVPLFDRQGPVYRTARARAPLVAPQEFPPGNPPAAAASSASAARPSTATPTSATRPSRAGWSSSSPPSIRRGGGR
jgi:hypothetical protein